MKKLLFIAFVIISTTTFAQFGSQNEISKATLRSANAKSFDLDGDGDMDVLSASADDHKIAWYENLGGGNFGIQQVITTNANGATSVYAADLDGDGDIDVLSASYYDDKIAWYENLGGGNFGAQQVISTSTNGASSVYAADLDGDGDIDVLSASSLDTKIAWYENLGGGSFDVQQVIIGSTWLPSSVYAADLDGDGDMDVLSASYNDDKIAWYENLGSGNFGIQQVITTNADGAKSVYAADLDGDGDIDVLSASSLDNKIAWYKNLGGGSFGVQQVIIDSAKGANSVHAADLDGDGDMDVLSNSYNDDKIAWHENLGSGNFGIQQVITTNADGAKSVYAADLDGDGDIDVLSASYLDNKIAWYENLGGGSFGVQQAISTSAKGASSVYAADLDGDGDMDVLSASISDHKIAWYENLDGGNFGIQQVIIDSAKGANSVYAADLDGDGDMDVLSSSISDDKIAWYENLGGGNFGAQQVISTNVVYATSVYAADLDGDGDMDILSASYSDRKIAWYENLGSGNFGIQQVITTNAVGANSVYAADLDGDGDLDVLSASYDDDKIAWYENLGGGSFGIQQVLAIFADGAQSVYAADLDGDGDMDVLSASYWDNKIAWYPNLGGGSFGLQQKITTKAFGATSVYAADLDGDGDIDVLSSGGDAIDWYENLGGGSFGSKQMITVSVIVAKSVYAADLDGDGDMDVLSASHGDHKIAWYENFFNNMYKLRGRAFYDANQNGVLDDVEQGLHFIKANLQPSSIVSFTSNKGDYFHSVDSGSYTVSYNIPDTLWSLTTDSATYTRTLSGATPIADSLDFGFYPSTILTSINPELTGGFPRCNQTINYWTSIRNQGTTIPNGVIHLQLDDAITYVSAAVTPDSIIGQNIYWSYNSLFFYTEENFNLQVKMPPFTSMGNTLISVLTVHELDGSNNIVYTNTDTLHQVSVCAYDPNDKNVTPEGLGLKGYIKNNQELEYLIRFQNTGNDTAITVMVRDQLDSDLDWSSLQPIASSHPMQVSVEEDGEAVFKFKNIMLPDSGANFLGSQGFVKFKINMKSNLFPETPIHNTSHIYFDNNPAVITNTVLNTIYDCDTIPINIPYSTICFGEQLYASSTDIHGFNSYTWEMDSFHTATTDSLNWVADTAGTFSLKLTISNSLCSKDTVLSITVLPIPPVTIAVFNPDTVCSTVGTITLPVGSPIGGSYSGTGISGSNFDPVLAGNGTHDVIYTYTDANSCINSDTTVITVQNCTGIDQVNNDFGILIYPNPNTGLFTIEKPTDLNSEVKVMLLDATSKLIIEKVIPIGQQKIDMDITSYSKGIYYLQLMVGDEVFVKQILKD